MNPSPDQRWPRLSRLARQVRSQSRASCRARSTSCWLKPRLQPGFWTLLKRSMEWNAIVSRSHATLYLIHPDPRFSGMAKVGDYIFCEENVVLLSCRVGCCDAVIFSPPQICALRGPPSGEYADTIRVGSGKSWELHISNGFHHLSSFDILLRWPLRDSCGLLNNGGLNHLLGLRKSFNTITPHRPNPFDRQSVLNMFLKRSFNGLTL